MKRFAALSVCILLMMVATAGATVVQTAKVTAGGIGLVYTQDTTSVPGYDVVDFFVSSLPAGETGLQAMQGELDAIGGTFYVYNKGATNGTYQLYSSQFGLDNPGSVPYSALNFAATVGGAVWTRDGGTTHNTSSIVGGWYDNGIAADALTAGTNVDPTGGATNGDGYAMNFLGQFVVTTGTTQITGNFSQSDPREKNGFGYLPNGDAITTAFTAPLVPEPSTIALLGCGLFGLLAYAWRKRK